MRPKPSPRQAVLAALMPLDPPPGKDAVSDGVIERVTSRYRHGAFTGLRASISVTEWAKGGTIDAKAHRHRCHGGCPPSPWPNGEDAGGQAAGGTEKAGHAATRVERLLASPRFMTDGTLFSPKLSAADAGTATHLVLQHLDFLRPCRAADLEDQIAYMLQKRLLTNEQAAAVNRGSIEWFVGSEVGQRVRHTPPEDVLREIPFNYAIPPEEFGTPASGDPADQVMLRGRIDLLLKQADGFHVIDYKTDNVHGEWLEQRVTLYAAQVRVYRDALRRFTGLTVGAVHLVFLTPRVVREV